MIPDDRPLPSNPEAEQRVIGTVLAFGAEALSDAQEYLTAGDLLDPRCVVIWQAGESLDAEGTPIDLVTIEDCLRRTGQLEAAGGRTFLSACLNASVSRTDIDWAASRVKEASLRREYIRNGMGLVDAAHETGTPLDHLAAVADQLASLDLGGRKAGYVTPGEIGPAVIANLEKAVGQKTFTALSTGLWSVDNFVLIEHGHLVILAARPSIGKTALALQIARQCGVPVGYFSLEMTARQLALRLLCAEARVSGVKAKLGELSIPEWERLTQALPTVAGLPIYLDDTADTIPVIRSRTRKMIRRHGIKAVFVDYLQLIRAGQRGQQTRENVVAGHTQALKAMAKRLGIPVIVLAQLNRAAEKQRNARPGLIHLRESGAIEQDADIVALLHRQRKFNVNDPAELIIAKQRDGSTDTALLNFLAEYGVFEDRVPREAPEPVRGLESDDEPEEIQPQLSFDMEECPF